MDSTPAGTPRHTTSPTGDHASLDLERYSLTVTRTSPDYFVLTAGAAGMRQSLQLTGSELAAVAVMLSEQSGLETAR